MASTLGNIITKGLSQGVAKKPPLTDKYIVGRVGYELTKKDKIKAINKKIEV